VMQALKESLPGLGVVLISGGPRPRDRDDDRDQLSPGGEGSGCATGVSAQKPADSVADLGLVPESCRASGSVGTAGGN
jgi:hypothetical protein